MENKDILHAKQEIEKWVAKAQEISVEIEKQEGVVRELEDSLGAIVAEGTKPALAKAISTLSKAKLTLDALERGKEAAEIRVSAGEDSLYLAQRKFAESEISRLKTLADQEYTEIYGLLDALTGKFEALASTVQERTKLAETYDLPQEPYYQAEFWQAAAKTVKKWDKEIKKVGVMGYVPYKSE